MEQISYGIKFSGLCTIFPCPYDQASCFRYVDRMSHRILCYVFVKDGKTMSQQGPFCPESRCSFSADDYLFAVPPVQVKGTGRPIEPDALFFKNGLENAI